MPGGQLYYEAAASGPAILLFHGGQMDRRMWDAQFELLAGERCPAGARRRHARAGVYSPGRIRIRWDR